MDGNQAKSLSEANAVLKRIVLNIVLLFKLRSITFLSDKFLKKYKFSVGRQPTLLAVDEIPLSEYVKDIKGADVNKFLDYLNQFNLTAEEEFRDLVTALIDTDEDIWDLTEYKWVNYETALNAFDHCASRFDDDNKTRIRALIEELVLFNNDNHEPPSSTKKDCNMFIV